MKLPCWLVGHSWGVWSKPCQVTGRYFTGLWDLRDLGPYTEVVQRRTCDKCGEQQERQSEA